MFEELRNAYAEKVCKKPHYISWNSWRVCCALMKHLGYGYDMALGFSQELETKAMNIYETISKEDLIK